MSKVTNLNSRLDQGKKAVNKNEKNLSKQIKKIDKEKVSGKKGKKRPSFAIYLTKEDEDRFSQAILNEKINSERKSDASKTLITEKLIIQWMDEKGY